MTSGAPSPVYLGIVLVPNGGDSVKHVSAFFILWKLYPTEGGEDFDNDEGELCDNKERAAGSGGGPAEILLELDGWVRFRVSNSTPHRVSQPDIVVWSFRSYRA